MADGARSRLIVAVGRCWWLRSWLLQHLLVAGVYRPSSGAYFGQTDDKNTEIKNKHKKYTKNTPNFGVFFVFFLCFLFFRRAGRTDRRTGRARTDGRAGHTYLSEARAGVYDAPGAYHGA
jgi:hypothetical protein